MSSRSGDFGALAGRLHPAAETKGGSDRSLVAVLVVLSASAWCRQSSPSPSPSPSTPNVEARTVAPF
jgi:hypothetical protein